MTMDQGSSRMTGSSSSGSTDKLQQTAGDVADKATSVAQQQVEAQVEPQLDRVADMLQHVADAVRHAGDEVRQEQPQVGTIADVAADQVQKASGFFRDNDMNGVIREVEDVARRQPVLFVGAAVALGALAARFLKASPSSGYAGGRAGFDRSYGGSYGSSGGYDYGSARGSGGGRDYGYGQGGYSQGYGQRAYGQGGYQGGYSQGYGQGGYGETYGQGTRGIASDPYDEAEVEVIEIDEAGTYGRTTGGAPNGGI